MESMESPVANVMMRMERRIGPEKVIAEKTKRIERATMAYYFTDNKAKGQDAVRSALTSFQTAEGNEIVAAKETLEVQLAAYLFAQNRRLFEARNGEGSMQNYDAAKELRQMESVVRALEGQHGQIGTGEGKTSVILPIATIIKSLTNNENQRAIFSSDSQLRVNEFTKFANPFIERLRNDGIADIKLQTEEDRTDKHKDKREALGVRMEKDALFGSQETTSELSISQERTKDYWQSLFQQGFDQKNKNMEKAAKVARTMLGVSPPPTIEVLTHNELMIRYLTNEEEFSKEKTPIYMDEAHAPFDRGTPTQLTSDALVFSPEQVKNATAEWALHYVVGHAITKNDVLYSEGQGTLSQEGEKQMGQISFHNVVENKNSPYHLLFEEAIKKIGASYGIEQQDALINLEKTVAASIRTLLPQSPRRTNDGEKKRSHAQNSEFSMYIRAIGEKIAQVYYMDSDAFITTPEGNLIIRDAYQDELLFSHQYDRETELATRGLTGLFKVVLPKKASGSKKFPSLLNAMAGRVTCFSGTLMDEGQKTSFARFLEDTTKQAIFNLENPHKKTMPSPEVSDTTEEATIALITSLRQDNRQSLIIDSTTIDHSIETYKSCVNIYGEQNVGYIGPKPTGDLNKEIAYEREVARLTSELAEGKIKVLISTGSIGVGMNIIKTNGEYPDIKVGILGIPKSRLQLKQILGRRRAPDSTDKQDYFWQIGEDDVRKFISFYQEEEQGIMDKYSRAVGSKKLTRDVLAEFEAARNNPVLMKKLIFDIMKNKETMRVSNPQNEIEYDKLYVQVLKYCNTYLTEKILQEVFNNKKVSELTDREREKLFDIVSLVGTPSSLYDDLTRPLIGRPLSADERSKKQIDLIRQTIVGDSLLKSEMDEWANTYLPPSLSFFSEIEEPMMELKYKEGYYPGMFAYIGGVPEMFSDPSKYSHVPIPDVAAPEGTIAATRLPVKEDLKRGVSYPLCLADASTGDVFDLHPLLGGLRQFTFTFGDAIQIARFPIPMENESEVYLYYIPLPKETPLSTTAPAQNRS